MDNNDVIHSLAKECIDTIQSCGDYEEAVDIFKYYGEKIKNLGGGLEWQKDHGKETFKVILEKI